MELGEPQLLLVLEQLVEPVARRMELEPVARVRRDEGTPAAVLLDPQVPHLRARERGDEVVLVERKAEVVDAGEIPLARLDDDVDGAALELRQTELEADPVELVPAVTGLERGEL